MADLDVLPIGELAGDRLEAGTIVAFERLEGLVAEHDAEAERVVGPVAFVHGDVVRRVGTLHQDREIQARWAAAENGNPHRNPLTNEAEMF